MGTYVVIGGVVKIHLKVDPKKSSRIIRRIEKNKEYKCTHYKISIDSVADNITILLSYDGLTKGYLFSCLKSFVEFYEYLESLDIINVSVLNPNLSFSIDNIDSYIVYIDTVNKLFKVCEFDTTGLLNLTIHAWSEIKLF